MKGTRDVSCCAPSIADQPVRAKPTVRPSTTPRSSDAMIRIAGGSFWMGSDDNEGYPADGERPAHKVRLRPFLLHATAGA